MNFHKVNYFHTHETSAQIKKLSTQEVRDAKQIDKP